MRKLVIILLTINIIEIYSFYNKIFVLILDIICEIFH